MIALDRPADSARSASLGLGLLIGILVLAAAAKPILFDTMDPDCFWHLRVAEQLRREGVRPLIDHLSFSSMTTPWTPYSWLAEIGMGALWSTAGWRAAVATHSILEAAFILFIAAACLKRLRPRERALFPQTPPRRGKAAETGVSCDRDSSPRRPGFLWRGAGSPCGEDPGRRSDQILAQDAPSCAALPRREANLGPDEMCSPHVSSNALQAVAAIAFAGFLSLPYMSFRPVTAALAMLALCNLLIVRDRQGDERTAAVWWIIPLTALMVNVHLYAVFVPLWIASLWIGAWLEMRNPREFRDEGRIEADHADERRRFVRYGWMLLGVTLACLMTPMLTGVIASALHYQNGDPMVASGLIAEMRPFYSGVAGKISAGLTLLLFFFAWRHRNRLRSGEWIWLAVATALLLRLGRFAPAFAIVAAPMFARTLPTLSDRVLKKRPVCALMALVLIGGSLRVAMAFPRSSVHLDAWLNRHGPDTPGYPSQAVDYVAGNITPVSGRIINEFTWGGFIEWKLGDRYQTLLDGRTQVFSPAFWNDVYLGNENRRSAYLSQVKADAAVLPIERSKFCEILLRAGWRVAYRDERAQVLTPPVAASASVDLRQ